MNSQSEKHAYWKKIIQEQEASGLSRREFCERDKIILSQFAYYYMIFKKKGQQKLVNNKSFIPVNLYPTSVPVTREIKLLLPNGLQLSFPYCDNQGLKAWIEVLKSC